MGRQAREAARALALGPTKAKNAALAAAAREIRAQTAAIMEADERDLVEATAAGRRRRSSSPPGARAQAIDAMAKGLKDIAALPDPSAGDGGVDPAEWLEIERVRVPLGVIGIIYESRPNVTADAGALCLKAGNAVILRGGPRASIPAGRSRCLRAG